VDTWQIMEGIVKSVFFGGAIGLISCYKGFTSGAGRTAAWASLHRKLRHQLHRHHHPQFLLRARS
jgi:hypothetical protein